MVQDCISDHLLPLFFPDNQRRLHCSCNPMLHCTTMYCITLHYIPGITLHHISLHYNMYYDQRRVHFFPESVCKGDFFGKYFCYGFLHPLLYFIALYYLHYILHCLISHAIVLHMVRTDIDQKFSKLPGSKILMPLDLSNSFLQIEEKRMQLHIVRSRLHESCSLFSQTKFFPLFQ